jgi:hypothetical protein
MKTKNTLFRNAIIALLGLVTFFFNTPLVAAVIKNDKGIELSYKGRENDLTVFKLVVNNEDAGDYIVTIKNEYGSILHTEKLRGENLHRTYKFLPEIQDEIAKSTFEVKNLKTKEISIYQVNAVYRSVDEISISRQ